MSIGSWELEDAPVEDRSQEDRAHVFAIDGSPTCLVSCGVA
jgi:hypothetical protein